jgi:hypothetical protein
MLHGLAAADQVLVEEIGDRQHPRLSHGAGWRGRGRRRGRRRRRLGRFVQRDVDGDRLAGRERHVLFERDQTFLLEAQAVVAGAHAGEADESARIGRGIASYGTGGRHSYTVERLTEGVRHLNSQHESA